MKSHIVFKYPPENSYANNVGSFSDIESASMALSQLAELEAKIAEQRFRKMGINDLLVTQQVLSPDTNNVLGILVCYSTPKFPQRFLLINKIMIQTSITNASNKIPRSFVENLNDTSYLKDTDKEISCYAFNKLIDKELNNMISKF